MLILVPQITNRLKYVLKLVLGQRLGINYTLTVNPEEFLFYQGKKINYSFEQLENEPFIAASDLLFQTGIKDQNIHVFYVNELPVFFSTSRKSILPFDVFAATFFMVSRYEEYLPVIRDSYDRFEATSSFAHQHNFLQKPIVDWWILLLRNQLQQIFPDLVLKKNTYSFISTIDIDNAYAYLEKGIVRTAGAYLKSVLKRNIPQVVERTRVLLGNLPDPYNTYQFQIELQKKYKFKTIYFFLLGDYGYNDTNVSASSKKFCSLIKKLADYYEVGIHPSFGSSENPEKVNTEINRLSKITHREITKSRQHFLKLNLPDTYRTLIDLDITDDYTMGFANELGFRAGTSMMFNFYNLDNETETPLKIHPFAAMEATLNHYMKINPEDAIEKLKPIIDEVKKVNGTFISLWHNESMSNWGVWKGWKNVYEDMVKYAI
ncbi:MAG: polysaccharide deacetylase family protein [Bacteroidia bacterium]|nr:polysaccharide deacetylase family protein [Bacteroidia bacterium]